ncbi:MAG TPA: hypothetical protein VIS07_09885 [Candidatus Binatia bacterium]
MDEPQRRHRIQRALLLALLLATFVAVVLRDRPIPGGFGVDGSYYVHVARHVADGDGLVTRVSMHNQGLRELPSPATVYPLWPLVLGLGGRLIGVELAAIALPIVLAAVALSLLYALANALARGFGPRADVLASLGPLEVTYGHVAVLLLASSRSFVDATLQPLTEPLAFTMLLASLLALERALGSTRPLGWAVACGALAAGAYLTRYQLAAAIPAVVVALALAARRERRFVASVLGALAGAALVLAPWIVHLAARVGDLNPALLVDFAAHRETPELPPGPVSLGGDALASIAAGFLPGAPSRVSYVARFGIAALAVPLATLVALGQRLVSGRWPLAGRSADLAVAVVLVGLGSLLPGHLSPLLNARHRLPFILLVAVALPVVGHGLLAPQGDRAARTRWRALVAGILLVVIALPAAGALPRSRGGRSRVLELIAPPPAHDVLAAAWLDRNAKLVAMVIPQRLAALTTSTGFHWIGCRSAPSDVRALLEHLPIEMVVVRQSQRRCRWASSLPPPRDALVELGTGPDAIAVYPAAVVRSSLTHVGDDDRRRRRDRRRKRRSPAQFNEAPAHSEASARPSPPAPVASRRPCDAGASCSLA